MVLRPQPLCQLPGHLPGFYLESRSRAASLDSLRGLIGRVPPRAAVPIGHLVHRVPSIIYVLLCLRRPVESFPLYKCHIRQ